MYQLSEVEKLALSFGLDRHISSKLNENDIKTEFECLYQDIVKNVSTLSEDEKGFLKTKLRNTCDKYKNVKIPFKQQTVINTLMKKKEIVIMKQDKGRGVVIMDRTKYIDKCLRMLQTPQFTKLDTDPTKTTERKVQNLLRKIKAQLPDGIYKKLYPSGSQSGLFY